MTHQYKPYQGPPQKVEFFRVMETHYRDWLLTAPGLVYLIRQSSAEVINRLAEELAVLHADYTKLKDPNDDQRMSPLSLHLHLLASATTEANRLARLNMKAAWKVFEETGERRLVLPDQASAQESKK